MRTYEGQTLQELAGLLTEATMADIKEELSTRESLYLSDALAKLGTSAGDAD